MLKNKKKLRRIERNTPGYAVKAAQSLVLAGALVGVLTLGGAGGAMAAAINQTGSGAVSIDKDTTLGTKNYFDADGVAPKFKTDKPNGSYTTLTIAGNSSNVSLFIGHKTTFTDTITVSGTSAGAASGLLVIAAGNTANDLFTGGATAVDAYGVLQVGADGATTVTGTAGNAKLASLTIADNGGLVLGGIGVADTSSAGNGGAGVLLVEGEFKSLATGATNIGGTGGEGGSTGAGGAGGAGTLTLKGDTNSFAGAVNIGGESGNNNGGNGGIGGEGILNLAAGTTTFGGAVQIGAAKDDAATIGAAGTLNIYGGATALFNENVTIGAAASGNSTLQIGGVGGVSEGAGTATLAAGKTLAFVTGGSDEALLIGGAGANGASAVPGAAGGAGTLNVLGTLTGTNGTLVLGGLGGDGSGTALGNGGAGGDGTLNLKAGSTTTFVAGQIIGGKGGNGAANSSAGGVGGKGTLNIESGATSVTFNTLVVGGTGGTNSTAPAGNGGEGEVNVDATVTFANTVTLGGAAGTGASDTAGKGGKGTLNIKTGTTTFGNSVQVGGAAAYGGAGELNIAAGATAHSSANNVSVGNSTGNSGAGTITIADGGAFRLDSSADLIITNGKVVASKYTVGDTASTEKGLVATQVDIGAKGVLEVKGNLTLTQAQLANSGLTSGINLASGGVLHVKDTLNITNGGSDVVETVAGHVMTNVFKADDGSKKLSWDGGTLTMLGDGQGVFLQASALDIGSGGTVNFGAADSTPQTSGGSFSKTVTVENGGTLAVRRGEWSVGKLDVQTSSTFTVGSGSTIAILKVKDNTAAGGDFKNKGTTSIANLGQLHVGYDQIVDGAGVKRTNVDGMAVASGGTLKLTGTDAKVLTTAQAQTLKGALIISGGGLLDLGSTDLGIVGNNADYADVKGLTSNSLAQTTVAVTTSDAGNTTNGINGGFKDLTFNVALSANQDLNVVGSLTLGGAGLNSALVGNTGDFAVAMKVANNSALTLGQATGAPSGGTLNGGVLLANTGSIFNVVNGEFKLTGDLDSTLANSKVILEGATLRVEGAIGQTNASDVTLTGANLIGGGAVTLASATLKNGGLSSTADATTAGNGDLKVTGNLNTSSEKNVIFAGNDLTIGRFVDVTDSAAPDNGVIKNATITAGKDFTISNNGIDGQGVNLKVGGALKTTDSGAVIADANSFYDVKTLNQANTGAVAVTGASTLVVTDLTLASGKGVTIGKTGETADGSVLVATKTDLNGGILQVLNAKASLGELTGTTGTLFVDPAYVNIASVGTGFGGSLLAGEQGLITVGNLSEAWVMQAIKESGAAADSSVLGIQKSIALGAGSIVVDKDVKSTGFIGSAAGAPAQNIYFGNKSLLAIDGSQFLSATGDAAIEGTARSIFIQNTGTEQARLHITKVKTGDTVYVLDGVVGASTAANSTTAWLDSNITFDTMLFKGEGWTNTANTNYTVNVHSVGATNVFPKLSHPMGGLVDNVMSQYGLQTDHENAGVRFVSRAVSDSFGLGGHNADRAAATIEGAAQMGAVAGVQISTIGAASVASSAVTTRTSFAQPLMDMTKAVAVNQDADGNLSLDTGLNAGNGMKNGLGVWIMPLYQSNKTWGQKAENFKSGMSSDLGGIALGADYTINDMFRFGAAFNVGGGYAQSSGDFNETENRFNFWGVNLYGGWTMNNFGLSADVGYTSSFNAVEQELPTSMAMGNLKADVTTSAWTAGLKGEYKFETSVVDIIPHVGVRYMGLTTDSYDVKSGGTVFGVERDFQSIWTFPIGVAFSKTIESDSGWMFKPMVDLTIIPAAGDLDAKSKASIPGVGGNAEMKMQVVDAITYDGGVGFEVGKGDLSFGLNYNIQASEHRTGHGVFGTLRYEF